MTVKTYTTIQNDAWDAIAYRLWDEERLFGALMAANPEYLDTVLFPAGVVLTLPERPTRPQTLELPPWR